MTNLPDHEFDMDDFKEIYHLRWNQENSYRDLKYPLCLKALHSKKYEYVAQEIWARAILYNFCSEIAFNVGIEQNVRKYEYQVNYSEAVKTCRGFLRIHDGKSVMDVEGLIASNIEAVRPGRTFPRQKRFKIPMSFCYRN
nr:transposase [uncultured Schaedlerella sp.]